MVEGGDEVGCDGDQLVAEEAKVARLRWCRPQLIDHWQEVPGGGYGASGATFLVIGRFYRRSRGEAPPGIGSRDPAIAEFAGQTVVGAPHGGNAWVSPCVALARELDGATAQEWSAHGPNSQCVWPTGTVRSSDRDSGEELEIS
jgi:hypothetical protein